MFEQLKLTDPALVSSLSLLKNNTIGENKMILMLNRARIIEVKYNQLVTQLRVHGVDFIIATGKAQQQSANQLDQETRGLVKKSSSVKRGMHQSRHDQQMSNTSGFFSSLNKQSMQQQLSLHQKKMKKYGSNLL